MADPTLFDLAERRLDWLDRRQGLLARNIANADTPGFRPRDLAPFSETLTLAQAAVGSAATPARTNPLHLAGAGPEALGLTTLAEDGTTSVEQSGDRSADGNGVQLDRELTRVADTDAQQELVGNLYHKYMTLYRTALGR